MNPFYTFMEYKLSFSFNNFNTTHLLDQESIHQPKHLFTAITIILDPKSTLTTDL
jgi:hypothetical protein